MEWIIGIYLAIGAIKTLNRMGASPALKPIWMSSETNPLKIGLFFTIHSLLWPFT